MTRPSRLEHVQRRLRITRYAIGVSAAGAFAAGAFVVRAAHPAGQAVQSGTSQTTEDTSSATTDSGLTGAGTDDSGSYLSPATTPSAVQSSGS